MCIKIQDKRIIWYHHIHGSRVCVWVYCCGCCDCLLMLTCTIEIWIWPKSASQRRKHFNPFPSHTNTKTYLRGHQKKNRTDFSVFPIRLAPFFFVLCCSIPYLLDIFIVYCIDAAFFLSLSFVVNIQHYSVNMYELMMLNEFAVSKMHKIGTIFTEKSIRRLLNI